jgi:hypothetical protein
MTSLDTYTAVNVVVPAVLSGVLWALIFFPLLFVLCLVDDVPRFLVEMLQLGMSDIEESDSDSRSCVKVDGCKIKKNFLKLLVLLVIPLTVTTIFFSFWNVWLVQEEPTGGCLPNFDCFPMLGDRVLQDTPVETCSQSFNLSTAVVDLMNDTSIYADTAAEGELAPDAITYKCYRFVFRYAEGIGAAGGILFFTAILTKLYVSIFVSIYNMDNDALAPGCLIGLWIATPALWLLFILVNTTVPIVREVVFQTTTDSIQFALYAANFGAVVVAGGYLISIGIIRANN